MKQCISMILLVMLVLGSVSCKNEGTLPLKGPCVPVDVQLDLRANAAVAPIVDQSVAALCKTLGLPIETLAQFNGFMSSMLSQLLLSKMHSVEFVSETEMAFVASDQTESVGQYRLKNGVLTIALPRLLTGLPVPLPVEVLCKTDGKGATFYLDRESIEALIESPLFTLLMTLLEGELGGTITADALRQLFQMMEEVSISLHFARR